MQHGKIQHGKNGSALISILLIIMIILWCLQNMIHSKTYLNDIVLKKEQQEKIFRATEGLLEYAIAWCIHYPEKVTSQEGELRFEILDWFSAYQKGLVGIIRIHNTKNNIHIQAGVQYEHATPVTLSCTLDHGDLRQKAQKKHPVVLTDWKQI